MLPSVLPGGKNPSGTTMASMPGKTSLGITEMLLGHLKALESTLLLRSVNFTFPSNASLMLGITETLPEEKAPNSEIRRNSGEFSNFYTEMNAGESVLIVPSSL